MLKVISRETNALGQPSIPKTVYVIVAVPTETPVTMPVVEFTVAIAVSDEIHEPPFDVDEKVGEKPMQTF